MIIYIIILFLLILLTYRYDIKGYDKGAIRWQHIVVFILILLAGLRNRVGGDTINYELRFNEWPDLLNLHSKRLTYKEITQPLWFLINVTLKSVWHNFLIVQFFHAIVFNLLLYRFIRKTTDKVFTAFLVIYCMVWWNFNFEVLRESLCVVIYLNSLLYLKENDVKKFILCVFPALFIHYFSFVIIALSLLLYYAGKKTIIVVCIVLALVTVFIDTSYLSNFIIRMVIMSVEDASTIVENYLEGDMYGLTSLNIKGVILQLVLLMLPLLISLGFKGEKKDFNIKLLWLYMLIFVLQSIFPIFSRFANYLIVLLIIETINYLYNRLNFKHLSYFAVLFLLLFSVGKNIYDFYKPAANLRTNLSYDCRYFPYTSIFQDPDRKRELYYGK